MEISEEAGNVLVAWKLLAFSGIVCDACSRLSYVQARFRVTCHDRAITLMTVSLHWSVSNIQDNACNTILRSATNGSIYLFLCMI